jgi:hypothetical protein
MLKGWRYSGNIAVFENSVFALCENNYVQEKVFNSCTELAENLLGLEA